jgi:hypothetical protein
VEFTVDSRLFQGKDEIVYFSEPLKTENLGRSTKGNLNFGVGFSHMKPYRKIVGKQGRKENIEGKEQGGIKRGKFGRRREDGKEGEARGGDA